MVKRAPRISSPLELFFDAMKAWNYNYIAIRLILYLLYPVGLHAYHFYP